MATATSPPAARTRPAGSPGPGVPRSRVRFRRSLRNWVLFALLAGPNIALLVVFTYRPLLQSFYLSTLQWNLGSPTAVPIGLRQLRGLVLRPGNTAYPARDRGVHARHGGWRDGARAAAGGAAQPEAALPRCGANDRRGPVRALRRRGRPAVAVRVRPELRRALGAARNGRDRLSGLVHGSAVGARDGRHRVPVEERRIRRAHLPRRIAGGAPGSARGRLPGRRLAGAFLRLGGAPAARAHHVLPRDHHIADVAAVVRHHPRDDERRAARGDDHDDVPDLPRGIRRRAGRLFVGDRDDPVPGALRHRSRPTTTPQRR